MIKERTLSHIRINSQYFLSKKQAEDRCFELKKKGGKWTIIAPPIPTATQVRQKRMNNSKLQPKQYHPSYYRVKKNEKTSKKLTTLNKTKNSSSQASTEILQFLNCKEPKLDISWICNIILGYQSYCWRVYKIWISIYYGSIPHAYARPLQLFTTKFE